MRWGRDLLHRTHTGNCSDATSRRPNDLYKAPYTLTVGSAASFAALNPSPAAGERFSYQPVKLMQPPRHITITLYRLAAISLRFLCDAFESRVWSAEFEWLSIVFVGSIN